ALKDFATLLRQDPNSGDTLIDRGDVLEKMGQREEALADYTQAITAARNNYDKQIKTEKKEERRAEDVRDRDRTIARAHVHRGNALRAMGRVEGALAEYARALELRPDDGYIYVNRGWLNEKRGRLDLARADYEKAASLKTPDDWLKRALERTRCVSDRCPRPRDTARTRAAVSTRRSLTSCSSKNGSTRSLSRSAAVIGVLRS